MKFEVAASISYWGMTPEEDWVLASEGWPCTLEGKQPPHSSPIGSSGTETADHVDIVAVGMGYLVY